MRALTPSSGVSGPTGDTGPTWATGPTASAGPRAGLRAVGAVVAVAALLGGGCAGDARAPERAATPATVVAAAPPAPPTPWVTRAIPEARGTIRAGADGKLTALRYRGWTTEDFGAFRTYAYDDARPEPPAARGPMPKIAGDPRIGRRLFLDRNRGPCTGCHLIRGDDVWPAGSVGPDLSTVGDRGLTDAYLFDMIYDPRHVFPNTTMPPWGTQHVFTPVEIVHLVSFLQTEKGPLPVGERRRAQSGHARPARGLRGQPGSHQQPRRAPRRGDRGGVGAEGAGRESLRGLPRRGSFGIDAGRRHALPGLRARPSVGS